jgi:hypothetical protein
MMTVQAEPVLQSWIRTCVPLARKEVGGRGTHAIATATAKGSVTCLKAPAREIASGIKIAPRVRIASGSITFASGNDVSRSEEAGHPRYLGRPRDAIDTRIPGARTAFVAAITKYWQ